MDDIFSGDAPIVVGIHDSERLFQTTKRTQRL
jgi:hypothetical protein